MNHRLLLLISVLFHQVLSDYFPCSDEYSSDFQVYGNCIAQTCGRFVAQIPQEDMEIIEQVADLIHMKSGKNSTFMAMDLASNVIDYNNEEFEVFEAEKDPNYQVLSGQMIDKIGHFLRKKVKDIFDLGPSHLWIAKPMLLSWIRANPDHQDQSQIYSQYHVDQLTYPDSIWFHYTAVIYLDNESQSFHGGHLQFGNGAIYTPRKGLAVIFTSGDENLHRVTPILWGMRRALTVFLTCDKSTAFYSRKIK